MKNTLTDKDKKYFSGLITTIVDIFRGNIDDYNEKDLTIYNRVDEEYIGNINNSYIDFIYSDNLDFFIRVMVLDKSLKIEYEIYENKYSRHVALEKEEEIKIESQKLCIKYNLIHDFFKDLIKVDINTEYFIRKNKIKKF